MIRTKKVNLKNEPKKKTLWSISHPIEIYHNPESEYDPPITSNVNTGSLLVNEAGDIFLVTGKPSLYNNIQTLYFSNGFLKYLRISTGSTHNFRKLPNNVKYTVEMSKGVHCRTIGSINITNLEYLLSTGGINPLSLKSMIPDRWYRRIDNGDYHKVYMRNGEYYAEKLWLDGSDIYCTTITCPRAVEEVPLYDLELLPEDFAIEVTF